MLLMFICCGKESFQFRKDFKTKQQILSNKLTIFFIFLNKISRKNFK